MTARVCRPEDGLFPRPHERGFSCSRPDAADVCQHVAASSYGIGARPDAAPDLLFVLRGVSAAEMVAHAATIAARPDDPSPAAASKRAVTIRTPTQRDAARRARRRTTS